MSQCQKMSTGETADSEVESARKLTAEENWSDAVSLLEAAYQTHPLRNVSMKMRHFQQIFSVPRHRSLATAC